MMFTQNLRHISWRNKIILPLKNNSHTVCFYATKARTDLLKSIYQPSFANLVKDSPEYDQLAESGKVWEDFFRPGNIEPYLQAQADLKQSLNAIDEFKDLYQQDAEKKPAIIRALVPEYAQQSTSIELNPLDVGDSVAIFDKLEKQMFCNVRSLGAMSTDEVLNLTLPTTKELLPGKDTNHVAELRNHIVVSRYITEVGLSHPGTAGLCLADIHKLSAMMLRDTEAEKLYASSWGGRTQLGDYRLLPIRVKSNPLRIFPYPQEVTACMNRYIEWRDRNHISKKLHPVILATQICAYFVHIHPFLDGNGRMSRTLMADYLIRQGYVPVVFAPMDREDYIKTISDAHDRKPGDLCTAVVQTQLEMLWEFSMRKE